MLLPADLEVRYFDAVMRGIGERLHAFGAAVVGGNLVQSTRHIAVDVALLGTVAPDRFVQRAGARPGDRILVTGWPGESAAGLSLLRAQSRTRTASTAGGRRRTLTTANARGMSTHSTAAGRRSTLSTAPGQRPTLSTATTRRLMRRHLDPTPRVHEGAALAAGGATAMVDASDGVAADLLHLCDASGVGAEVHVARLPMSPALRRAAVAHGVPAWRWTLYGGEDYELVCTAPPAGVVALQRAVQRAGGTPLHDIGVILARKSNRVLVHEDGRRTALSPAGWQHFSTGA